MSEIDKRMNALLTDLEMDIDFRDCTFDKAEAANDIKIFVSELESKLTEAGKNVDKLLDENTNLHQKVAELEAKLKIAAETYKGLSEIVAAESWHDASELPSEDVGYIIAYYNNGEWLINGNSEEESYRAYNLQDCLIELADTYFSQKWRKITPPEVTNAKD